MALYSEQLLNRVVEDLRDKTPDESIRVMMEIYKVLEQNDAKILIQLERIERKCDIILNINNRGFKNGE